MNKQMIQVGVADMKLTQNTNIQLATHALGSCLGITLYDPESHVGGLFHAMLPHFNLLQPPSIVQPLMFLDTGLPLFFHIAIAMGARKDRLQIKVAGGAAFSETNDTFKIGKTNILTLRKLLWRNNMIIQNEHVGGDCARSLYLDIESGKTWLKMNNTIEAL